jgi:hypothetical protein
MGTVQQQIVLNQGYNLESARELVLKPVFTSDSVLSRTATSLELDVFDVAYNVKEKRKFKRIGKMGPVLKGRTNCNTWDPNAIQMSVDSEFSVYPFELEAELCADEFEGVWENIRGAGNNMHATEGELARQLEEALVLRLRQGLTNDLHRMAWFSEAAFATTHATGLAKLDLRTKTTLEDQMAKFEGFWPTIETRVTASQISYVNTYDGTTNYATSANIVAFFRAMLDAASEELLGMIDTGEGFFLVQRPLLEAYRTYLQGLGTEMANAFLVDGKPVRNVLYFEGIPVIAVPEWSLFDRLVDTDAGKGKNRGILTVASNLQIGTDVASTASLGNGQGLRIYQSPEPSAKGRTEMYAGIRLGVGIAYNDLMVAAYNGTTLP